MMMGHLVCVYRPPSSDEEEKNKRLKDVKEAVNLSLRVLLVTNANCFTSTDKIKPVRRESMRISPRVGG